MDVNRKLETEPGIEVVEVVTRHGIVKISDEESQTTVAMKYDGGKRALQVNTGVDGPSSMEVKFGIGRRP